MLKIVIEISTVDVELEIDKNKKETVCPVHGVVHHDMIGAGAIGIHTVEKDATTTEKAVSLVIMQEVKKLLESLSRSTIHQQHKVPPAVSDN